MSGLLERIVRRRRASASSRLGPPSQNGSSYTNGSAYANGGAPSHAAAAVNGSAAAHQADGAATAHDETPATAHDEAPEQASPVAVEATPHPPAPALDPDPPRPSEGPPATFPSRPGFVERGRMRRRARYLRKLREVQMRDIGGFLLELHRFGRQRPELVQAKIAGAVHTDRELRALERALGEQRLLRELREPGLGGACHNCGAVHGSADRFCASCGEPLGTRTRSVDP